VRNRRDVANGADFDPGRSKCADRRLAARSRTGDTNIDRAQTVIAGHAGGVLCCLLCRERRALARTAEAKRAGALPAERVADGVVMVTMVLLKDA